MLRNRDQWLKQGIVPLIIIAFVVTLGALFYVRAQSLMAAELRYRLVSAASLAAQQFDTADIEAVWSPTDGGSLAHRRLVERLQNIRVAVPSARFVYLVRATDDPDVVAFIADADEFVDPMLLDHNGDGVVGDDEVPAHTGDPYDIADVPEFQKGFVVPSVDQEVTYDQWGALISGYAPVRDSLGRTIAVLGIDMDASEFQAIARSIFSPVALLFVLVAGMMLALFSFSVLQRRRYEALRLVDRERTSLLDLATHQLGVPLATFRWWLEILRDRCSGSTEDVEALDQLQVGVDRLDGIIRSLQEASLLQAGDVAYHPVRTDATSFLQSTIESMRPRCALKRQQIVLDAQSHATHVMVDPAIMRSVVQELLENACGFSPEGSTITVRLHTEHGAMRIDVVDHGCGIPAKDQGALFQKFVRASNAAHVKPVGTGLGLYICKGLVERAGGSLRLVSTENVGTTVSIFLPLAS